MTGRLSFGECRHLRKKQLEDILNNGVKPDWRDLEGYDFKGLNLSFPGSKAVPLFMKGFYKGDAQKMGYNIDVNQNCYGTWVPLADSNDSLQKYRRHFSVEEVAEKEKKHHNALLFDYSKGNNGLKDFTPLHDYLVQPDENNRDLFLGVAYFTFFNVELRFLPQYFVLERHRESEF